MQPKPAKPVHLAISPPRPFGPPADTRRAWFTITWVNQQHDATGRSREFQETNLSGFECDWTQLLRNRGVAECSLAAQPGS